MPEAVKWNVLSFSVVNLAVYPFSTMTDYGCTIGIVLYYVGMSMSTVSIISFLYYIHNHVNQTQRTKTEQMTIMFKMLMGCFVFFIFYFAMYNPVIKQHQFYIDEVIPVNYNWCHLNPTEESLLTMFDLVSLAIVVLLLLLYLKKIAIIHRIMIPLM